MNSNTSLANTKIVFHLIYILIGFTAVIAQIVLLREFIVVFHGNEISLGIFLGNWLLWTAAGSFLLGKLIKKAKHPEIIFALLQILIAIIIPVTILLIRFSKQILQDTPGEILGLFSIFIDAFVVLCLFCLFSGGLFSTGTYLLAKKENKDLIYSSGTVYLFESIGSGLGGVLVSLLLIPSFGPIQIALFISMVNIFVAIFFLLIKIKLWRRAVLFLILTVLLFIISTFNSISYKALWNDLAIVTNQNSVYGNLTILDVGGNKILYENGLVLFTVPDQERNEEVVHFSLLQHSDPADIMLISGGVSGIISEMLKYPSVRRIDYVELDPAILKLAEKYLKNNWQEIKQNSHVRIYHQDARQFLKQSKHNYDVIIVNLPDPHTAQLNRFYTREFLQIAADRLNKKGILTFQLSASENYISEGLAKFLRCIHKTLLQVFKQVAYIPGNTIHFFATNQSNKFYIDPDSIISNLHARNIQTEYIREYYIPFRLMPDRVHDLDRMIKPMEETKVNSDFSPIAYYYDLVLWTSQFLPKYNEILYKISGLAFNEIIVCIIIFFLIGIFTLSFIKNKNSYVKFCSGLAVIFMGFTSIALEIILLLSFQAIYGYIYHQLALIIASFMTGMAFSSWMAIKISKRSHFSRLLTHLTIIHGIAVFISIGLIIIIRPFSDITDLTLNAFISYILYPAIAVICGGIGGYQFPIVSGIYFKNRESGNQNTGIVYGLDLIGAVIGALFVSIILIPLFGFFNTAILMGILNSIVIVFILTGLYLKRE